MAAIRRLLLRLGFFVRAGHAESDLAREIDSHLHLLEDKFVAQGMSADDARSASLQRSDSLGGVSGSSRRKR